MSIAKFVGAAAAAVGVAGAADAQVVTYGPPVVYSQPAVVVAPQVVYGPGYYGGGVYRPVYSATYAPVVRTYGYGGGYYNGYYGGTRGYYGPSFGYSNYGRRGGVSFGFTIR